VCRGTIDWEELTQNFKKSFSFEDDTPLIESALQVIKNKIFSSKDSYNAPRFIAPVEEVFHCYNVVEEYQEEEYPRNVQIKKLEVST